VEFSGTACQVNPFSLLHVGLEQATKMHVEKNGWKSHEPVLGNRIHCNL
jgi:hypothetical protein